MARDVDKSKNNIDELMTEIGDISSTGTIKDIVDEFRKISIDWNMFLDNYLINELGEPTPPTTEQEKIDKIREKAFYKEGGKYKSDFVEKLQKEVEKGDSKRVQLKNLAEATLKKEHDLLQANKKIIKELNDELEKDEQKKEKLEQEILEKETEKVKIDGDIDVYDAEITRLENEISGLDPINDKDEIESLKNEKNSYENKKVDLLRDKNSIDAEITNKTNEKNKIDITTRKTKIGELEKKNKDLEKHLEKNYKDLNDEFIKDGITILKPGEKVEKEATSPGEKGTGDTSKEKSSRGNGYSSSAPAAAPEDTNKAIMKLTDKQIAKNLARQFREAKTTADKKAIMEGYGYSDLIAMSPYLGILDRKRMLNFARESRDRLEVIDSTEFKDLIDKIPDASINADKLYAALFESNKPRDFKDLKVDELRSIEEAIEKINENRLEIAGEDPENLKELDKYLVEFVNSGSLIERLKTGKVKGAFSDLFNGKKKAVRDRISGAMEDYNNTRSEEEKEKISFENSIRKALGQEVLEEPNAETLDNTRYGGRLDAKDKEFVNKNESTR